ncbi:MAG: hypothetical protein ABJ242_02260 [Marinomonas sp.]
MFSEEPRTQQPLSAPAYDQWMTPDGEPKAGFYRTPQGILVRFYDEADFEISNEGAVMCWPASGADSRIAESLFANAITPMLANHNGGLNLHGSAVANEEGGIAFLGHSRSGKTTLAGACARAGMAFVTEDVTELTQDKGQAEQGYWLQPKTPELRLFSDSAEHLLGTGSGIGSDDRKQPALLTPEMAVQDRPVPLGAIFLLGDGVSGTVKIAPLTSQNALSKMLQHSFVLDVEDRPRLKAHFARLADLARAVPCFTLDYPREYSALPDVIAAVRAAVLKGSAQ